MTADEEDALRQHGLKSSALGDNCPTWLKKFTAMQVHLLPMPMLQTIDTARLRYAADRERRER